MNRTTIPSSSGNVINRSLQINRKPFQVIAFDKDSDKDVLSVMKEAVGPPMTAVTELYEYLPPSFGTYRSVASSGYVSEFAKDLIFAVPNKINAQHGHNHWIESKTNEVNMQ